MTKEKKVNIKLEVIRDDSSGDLSILAHFDSKAPNVHIDKNEYIWMPTIEERDLINDAFKFLPSKSIGSSTELKETKIEEPLQEEVPAEEPLPEITPVEEPLPETIPAQKPEPEETPEELPPLEKEEPAVFEVTDKDVPPEEAPIPPEEPMPPEEPKKDDEMDAKVDIKPGEEAPEEEKPAEDKKEEDEGIIVEADAEAIEAALKKHTGKDDKDHSIVEADEQTIIDKVLSQKKKGKWSRK